MPKITRTKHLIRASLPIENDLKRLKNTDHLKGFMLFLNPEFREKVEGIREKFKTENYEFDGYNGKNGREIASLMENVRLINEVENLRKYFKLSKRYDDFLVEYVVTDDSLPSYDIEGLRLEEVDYGNGDVEHKLLLTRETKLKDIIKAWPLIEKELGGKGKKNKSWKRFWRDYDIYELAKEGKTIDEICNIIEDKYGDSLDYGNIKKIESDFRKKIGIAKKYRKYKLVTSKI